MDTQEVKIEHGGVGFTLQLREQEEQHDRRYTFYQVYLHNFQTFLGIIGERQSREDDVYYSSLVWKAQSADDGTTFTSSRREDALGMLVEYQALRTLQAGPRGA